MAAARREAPRGAAGETWIGVERRSIPLTASKTAAWTMAATRVVTRGEAFAARAVWAMSRFQSVTTSARTTPWSAVMTRTVGIASRYTNHLVRTAVPIGKGSEPDGRRVDGG